MSVYKGLWKKEMAMMKGFHVVISLAFICIIVFMLWQDRTMLGAEWLVGMSTFSLILLPGTVLFSLNMEKHQLGMFLFTRDHITKQIRIKFLHGTALLVIYAIMVFSFTIVFQLFGFLTDPFFHTVKVLMVLFTFIFIISLLSSVAIYIAWVLHQWMREKAGFVISLITLFIFFNLILKLFSMTLSALSIIGKWWMVDVGSLVDIPFTIFVVEGRLSLSLVIVFMLILYLCYHLSTKLLQAKVEV